MIRIISLFFLLSFLSYDSLAQRDPDMLYYGRKVEKMRKMKNTGAFLTATGAVLFVVGVSVLLRSSSSSNNYSSNNNNSSSFESGEVAYLLGVAGLGAGIPLWIVGGHQQRKYERRFEKVSLGLNLAPQSVGFRLTCRF